jgi:hypothetical protein
MDWALIISNTVRSGITQTAIIYILAAIGMNLHVGYTGLMNFGQVGFLAVGAYGVAIATKTYDLPLGVGIVIGLLCGLLLALVLGIPTLRLRSPSPTRSSCSRRRQPSAVRTVRRPHGGRRRPRRDPARHDHRADRPERRRQDHVLQPAHRVRHARHGHVAVRRRRPLAGVPPAQGSRARHGAHLPAHQGAHQADGHREHEARATGPEGREAVELPSSRSLWRARSGRDRPPAPTSCSTVQARSTCATSSPALSGGQRKLLEMARALMTEPEDGDARRADGRREPGAHPVACSQHVKGLRDEGMTVLFVEHDMDMVHDISDWVIVMAEGRSSPRARPTTSVGRTPP